MSTEPNDFPAFIADIAQRQVREFNARVEQACEEAVAGGVCGVMIEGDRVWVDARVPYGQKWDVTACGSDHPNVGRITTEDGQADG